jgi:hypothetical protein
VLKFTFLVIDMGWSDDLNKIIKRDEASAEKWLRAAVIQAANVAVIKSAVGAPETWKNPAPPSYPGGGAFRSQWRLSIGVIDMTIKDTIDWSGVLPETASDILKFKLGDTLSFTNPSPYAMRLEYDGHSAQMPDGAARPAILALKKALNKEANK